MLLILLAQLRQPLGDDVAGQDRIDGDAVFRQLDAGGAHEAELPRLGRAVMGPAGIAGDRPGDRRGDDDAALLAVLEIGQAGLDRDEGALEVGVHHLVPGLGVVRSSILACGKMPALAHSTSRPPWRSTAVLAAACMSASLVTSPAKALAVPPAFVSSCAVASASLEVARDDQHLGAVAGEHAGDALADALAAAGDDDGLAFQGCRHWRSSHRSVYFSRARRRSTIRP